MSSAVQSISKKSTGALNANLGTLPRNDILHPSNTPLLDAQKLSVVEAGRLMGIGQTKLRALVSKGEIQCLRIGGKIMLLKPDCEKYLQRSYGVMNQSTRYPRHRQRSLPGEVLNSKHLKETGV